MHRSNSHTHDIDIAHTLRTLHEVLPVSGAAPFKLLSSSLESTNMFVGSPRTPVHIASNVAAAAASPEELPEIIFCFRV